MPIRVTDEQGTTHVFPDGSTPEMIAKALNVKLPTANPAPTGTIGPVSQRERFMNPDLYPVGVKGEGVGENLKNLAQRGGVGIFQLANAAMTPRQTLAGMEASVLPEPVVKGANWLVDQLNRVPGMSALTTKLPEGTQNPIRSAYEAVAPGGWQAAGNVAPAAGQMLAGDAFGEVLGGVTSDIAKVPEKLRTGAQSLAGAGERAVREQVAAKAKSAGLAAKATEEANRAALSKYDTDLRVANQNNVNAHVKWKAAKADVEKSNALAQKAVDEYNRAQQSAYQSNLDEAAKTNLRAHIDYLKKNADTAKENATKAKEVEEANRAEYSRYEKELAEAQRKNTEAHVKHQAAKAESELTNRGTKAAVNARSDLDTKIGELSNEFDRRVETQRNETRIESNKKYNELNGKLGGIEADPETMASMFGRFREDMTPDEMEEAEGGKMLPGSASEPSFLKSLRKSYMNQVPNYEDLQADYTKLGSEISKGTLPGPVYHAYVELQKAIGKEMGRIAESKGLGSDLKDAREYWRRRMQTFGDPFSFGDEASKQFSSTNPDFLKEQLSERWNRLADQYDPHIRRLRGEIDKYTQMRDALPREGARPTAEVPKPPEEKTVEPPKIQKPPQPKGAPSYPEEKTVEPPKQKPPAEQKEPPIYPEEQIVSPPRTNPIDVPEVSTPALRADLIDKWAKGETGLNKFQVSRLVGSAGLGTIIGAVFGHGLGTEVGSAAGALSYALSPAIVAKIISRPGVSEWLTRPPVGELEALQKLPYADRIRIVDGLDKVSNRARVMGIHISPVLRQWLAAAMGSGSQKPKHPVLSPASPVQ